MATQSRSRPIVVDRHDLKRLLTFSLLGPPMGALILIARDAILSGRPWETFYIIHPIAWLLFVLPSYVIGFWPALGAGLLSCVVARLTSRPALRLALSPIVGTLAGGTIYGLMEYVRYDGYEPRRWAQVMSVALATAWISAFASLLCTALVEWRGLRRITDDWRTKSRSGANRP